jgi:hypothetical protein
MAAGFKTGGRKPGSKNAKTLERERLQAEAAAELSKSGLDSSAANILRGVMNDPRVALHSRLDAAKALVREERGADDGERTYVAVMPLPVKDMDEWKALYMEAKPDASPEDVAWHEKLAKQILDADTGRKPLTSPPWIDDQKDEPNV